MIKHDLIHKIYNEIYPTNHLCLVERVWQCGCGCFLNNFSYRNACQ